MDLFVFLFLASLIYGVYSLFELFARRKERMMIIDKMVCSQTAIDPSKLLPLQSLNTRSFSSLRAACLMTGLGIGFVASFFILNLIPSNIMELYGRWEMPSIIMFGSVLIFGGIAMIVSFVIEQKISRNDRKNISGN